MCLYVCSVVARFANMMWYCHSPKMEEERVNEHINLSIHEKLAAEYPTLANLAITRSMREEDNHDSSSNSRILNARRNKICGSDRGLVSSIDSDSSSTSRHDAKVQGVPFGTAFDTGCAADLIETLEAGTFGGVIISLSFFLDAFGGFDEGKLGATGVPSGADSQETFFDRRRRST